MIRILGQQNEQSSFIGAAPDEHTELIPELYLRAFVDSHSRAVAVLNGSGTIFLKSRPMDETPIKASVPLKRESNVYAEIQSVTFSHGLCNSLL